MESTILLSRVTGLYMIVMGVIMMTRREYFKMMINSVVDAPATRLMIGIIMFIAGLFWINLYQKWGSFGEGLLSFFGWVLILKSLLYINLSSEGMRKWIAAFNVDGRYRWGGLLAILLGLYLANLGFGLI